MFQVLCLFLFSFTHTTNGLDFYVGYGDENDNAVKEHPMYNQALGIYHPQKAGNSKFCYGKSSGFYSMGPCRNFYAKCDDHFGLTVGHCPAAGQVFRQEVSNCVDQIEEPNCYTVLYSDSHPACQESGHGEMVALGDCENRYGVCAGDSAYYVDCDRDHEVFSDSYGACIPKTEHPKCAPQCEEEERKIGFKPLSSMCDPEKSNYTKYLGACNRKYMYCNKYAFVAQCDVDSVADGSAGKCIPISLSSACASNWEGKDDKKFFNEMKAILKSIDFCKSKSNGLYYNPHSECHREAILCYQNQSSFHLCPRGTGLDDRGWCSPLEACLIQEKDPEPARSQFLTFFASNAHLCQQTETDGIHVFGVCLNFYGKCHLGRFEIKNCDLGEIFDTETSQCRPPGDDDHCDRVETLKANRCQSPDRVVRDKYLPKGKCQESFSICMNGWEQPFNCEKESYVFNEASNVCVPKTENPDCKEYVKEIVVNPVIPVEKDLTCEGDGAFLEHENCEKFYRCAHGRKVEMSCAPGTAFDMAITTCNHKDQVARCKNQEKVDYRENSGDLDHDSVGVVDSGGIADDTAPVKGDNF